MDRLGESFAQSIKEEVGAVFYLVEERKGLPLLAASVPDTAFVDERQVKATACSSKAIKASALALEDAMGSGDVELNAPVGSSGFESGDYYIQARAASKVGSLRVHGEESWVFVAAVPLK